MEPQYPHPPLKLARFAGSRDMVSRSGDSWGMKDTRNENELPPTELGLELKLGCGSGTKTQAKTRVPGFTISQLKELQTQSLIYKYMEAGLPVPGDLVLPIWYSVAYYIPGGLSKSLCQFYPKFLQMAGYLKLEHKKEMDLEVEPGRCRRTDGKKWRCSKEAVPDHKYCERHIHRGRYRSRKLVEASSGGSDNNNTTEAARTCSSSSSNLSVNGSSSNGSNFLSPKKVINGGCCCSKEIDSCL